MGPLVTLSNDLWSSDTTILDVLHQVKLPQQMPSSSSSSTSGLTKNGSAGTLHMLLADRGAVVWDCTALPAVNISSKCHREIAQCTTLFAAGWYPSGYLQVLPEGSTRPRAANADAYDEDTRTFHSPTMISDQGAPTIDPNSTIGRTAAIVQLNVVDATSDARPLPSQVLNAVADRFGDTKDDDEDANARIQRQLNARAKAEADVARLHKLDERIRRLAAATNGEKNKNVSDQVRRMLIKSRATGKSDLREQDRVYLHCLFERATDDNSSNRSNGSTDEDYFFFSVQDTVARATSALQETLKSTSPVSAASEVEMLVFRNSSGTDEDLDVRRLPASLRFYEAIQQSYLTGTLDTVVVRWFDPKRDQPTALIATIPETSVNNSDKGNAIAQPILMQPAATTPCAQFDSSGANKVAAPSALSNSRHSFLLDALASLDNQKSTKTKKPTAALVKVRQMQIKSKATGDDKRIKLDHRFFLELVTVVDNLLDCTIDNATNPCSILAVSPIFVALSDKVDRHVRDVVKWPTASTKWGWELLRIDDNSETTMAFEYLATHDEPTDATWNTAVQSGTVKAYDRIVVRFYPVH